MHLPGCASLIAFSRSRSSFFKVFFGFAVFLRMRGTYLLSRHSQTTQQLAHRGRMASPGKFRFQPTAQVGKGPGRYAVALRVRPPHHRRGQSRPFRPRQTARRAPLRAVVKTGNALGVVARHRIAQRLTLHPCRACRRRPAHPVKCIGDRPSPRPRAPTRLAPCPTTEFVRRQIAPYPETRHGHSPTPHPAGNNRNPYRTRS